MTSVLNSRLARLEAREPPPLRQRLVWLRKGEPEPETEPGEQLTVVRWIWGSDDTTQKVAASTSGVAAMRVWSSL